jgi:hypothetical protein
MTNDDCEITNISCKSANKLYCIQFSVLNFKTFLRAENRVKTSKRMEQSRRR